MKLQLMESGQNLVFYVPGPGALLIFEIFQSVPDCSKKQRSTGLEYHLKPKQVLLLVVRVQKAGCLKKLLSVCWRGTDSFNDYTQSIIQNTKYKPIE